jgi:hypothetical protein
VRWPLATSKQASRHVAVSHSPAASVDLVRLCNGVFAIAPFSLMHLRVLLHPESLNYDVGQSTNGLEVEVLEDIPIGSFV